MKSLVLYCKSYRTDLKRVVRLVQSVRQNNTEQIPFYVSVPRQDWALFREHLQHQPVELIADEDILAVSPTRNADRVATMPGYLSQQVIKSEFWRLGLSQAYLCLDSDAFFIRPFGLRDFLAPDGTPYTVMDESHESLEMAMRHQRERVIPNYIREADSVQALFGRTSRRYSFGPFPLVWHRDVWSSLEQNYLLPRNMTLADAISQIPIESRWYGEALLAYKAISLLPCQPMFKVYHYAWEYDQDRRDGIQEKELSQLYSGVICQSAWEREMDWPMEGGSSWSRLARRLKRKLGRL